MHLNPIEICNQVFEELDGSFLKTVFVEFAFLDLVSY